VCSSDLFAKASLLSCDFILLSLSMDFRKTGFWQLVLLAFMLNFVVQTIHESGHWVVCETMGRKPVWGFNQLLQIWGDQPPVHPEEWIATVSPDGEKGWLKLSTPMGKNEYQIMLVVGPLFSVLGVLLGLILVRFRKNPATRQIGMVIALIGSLLMSQYYLRGFSRQGGDEYFLAASMGIPKYIFDIPFCLVFVSVFAFSVWSLGDCKTRLRWLGAVIAGSLPSGIFIMQANSLVLDQVNKGNRLFNPLLGWSLPVIIVNAIVCLGLFIWWKRASSIDNEEIVC
jgi:hypothetical protein